MIVSQSYSFWHADTSKLLTFVQFSLASEFVDITAHIHQPFCLLKKNNQKNDDIPTYTSNAATKIL